MHGKTTIKKEPIFQSDINKTRLFSTGFGKKRNLKYNENSSSRSLVVPCGRTD
jgi:hypothetical protein